MFDDVRQLARFRVFEMLSVKAEDLFRMCLVNLFVDFEEHGGNPATPGLRSPNIVP